jgi:hypothetical protein
LSAPKLHAAIVPRAVRRTEPLPPSGSADRREAPRQRSQCAYVRTRVWMRACVWVCMPVLASMPIWEGKGRVRTGLGWAGLGWARVTGCCQAVMRRVGAYGAAKVLAEPKAEGCAAAAGAGKDVANDANGLGAAERVWGARARRCSSLLLTARQGIRPTE